MKKRQIVRVVIAVGFAALVSVVQPTAAVAQEAGKIRLRMASLPAGTQVGMFLAQARGWLPNVEIEDGAGSVAALNTLAAGKTDIAEASIATMATARAGGLPFKAVSSWFPQNDLGFLVLEKSSIKTPKDFEGKKIAYAAASLEGPFVAPLMKSNGVDLSKVELVNMEFGARFSSFMSGQSDALVSVVPYALAMLKTGNKPSRALKFSDYGFSLLSTGLVVNEETLKNRKPEIQAVVSAISKAWGEVWSSNAARDEAIQAMIKARPNAKLDPVNIRDQVENYRAYYATANTKGKPVGWIARADVAAMLKTMKDSGVITKVTQPEEYYTDEFFK